MPSAGGVDMETPQARPFIEKRHQKDARNARERGGGGGRGVLSAFPEKKKFHLEV